MVLLSVFWMCVACLTWQSFRCQASKMFVLPLFRRLLTKSFSQERFFAFDQSLNQNVQVLPGLFSLRFPRFLFRPFLPSPWDLSNLIPFSATQKGEKNSRCTLSSSGHEQFEIVHGFSCHCDSRPF
jgi:hypothetical protein